MTVPFGDDRLPERFWSKVRVREDGCWEWTATRLPKGYGQFRWQGKTWAAHRVAFTTLVGPMPEGLQTDHLCRVRACVNPAHLEAVTPRENTLRGISQAAINAKKTHCPQGHALVDENVYRHPDGRRECLTCKRTQGRDFARRKRAQLLEEAAA